MKALYDFVPCRQLVGQPSSTVLWRKPPTPAPWILQFLKHNCTQTSTYEILHRLQRSNINIFMTNKYPGWHYFDVTWVAYRAPKSSHINPALKSLHWLKIKQRTDYKILSLTYTKSSLNLHIYIISSLCRGYVVSIVRSWCSSGCWSLFSGSVAVAEPLY